MSLLSSTAPTSRPAGTDFSTWSALPDTLNYENQFVVAEGDYVIAHGGSLATAVPPLGSPPTWFVRNGELAEHWDILQDEATRADSLSGLPM